MSAHLREICPTRKCGVDGDAHGMSPITAALTGIDTVDVGNPMLSMHSIREMAAVADHTVMISTIGRIFGADNAANTKRSGAAQPKGGTGPQTKSTKKKRSEKA